MQALVVTKLFNIVGDDFDAKKSARYTRVLVVTELSRKRDPVYVINKWLQK